MHWTVTDNDRDERGGIITEAPAAQPPTPKLSNRRGVADAPPEAPAAPRPDRRAIAGAVGGLVVAALLIAVISARSGGTPAQPSTAARIAPTAAAPAIVPTIAPSATPAPPTATPDPPTQTPVIVYVEVAPPCDLANPPYRVQLDVYAGSRPLGTVTGTSCDSQDAAQANADALAAQMKEGK